MKVRYALLAAAALLTPAFAGTSAAVQVTEAAAPAKRLSGLISLGYDSNYTGRGYVVSHSVAQGDSVLNSAVKLNYDLGQPGKWTLGSTIAYMAPCSGHTLYGNPTIGEGYAAGILESQYGIPVGTPSDTVLPNGATYGQMLEGAKQNRIGERNIENQFTIITEAKYASTTEKWNVAFGHNYTHGGLLGVMVKHYVKRGASCVNELFVTPEWTPHKAVAVGMKTSYSMSGLTGWWFEPYVTVKAPIVGTPQDPKLVGVVTVGATMAADIFADSYSACGNGLQAVFIKLSTPWFVTDNFILTPSVSFNWLGCGGNDANRRSEVRHATEDTTMIPFKNFGVVAGVSATYTF